MYQHTCGITKLELMLNKARKPQHCSGYMVIVCPLSNQLMADEKGGQSPKESE